MQVIRQILLGLVVLAGVAVASSAWAEALRATVVNAQLSALWTDAAGEILVAGGEDGSLWRSTNGGESWQQARVEGRFRVVHLADAAGGALLALAEDRLLRSPDRGESWQPVELPGGIWLTGVSRLRRDASWLASGSDGSLLRGTPDGTHWQTVFHAPAGQGAMRSAEMNDGTLVAAGMHGLLVRSGDGGKHWQSVSSGVSANIGHLLPVPAGVVAVWADGRVSGIRPDGRVWAGTPAGSEFPVSVAYDPVRRQILVGNAAGEVWRSDDLGKRWQHSTVQERIYLAALHVDARDGSLVAVGGRGTVARSSDGGAHWQILSGNLWTSRFNALAATPDGQRLFAAGTGGMLLRSDDRGQSWHLLQEDLKAYVNELLPGVRPGELWVSGPDGYLARSADAGRHWATVKTGLPSEVALLALVRAPHSGALMAAGPMATFLRSRDEGTHWQITQPVADAGEGYFSQIVADPDGEAVLLVGRDRLMRSADGGESWSPVAEADGPAIEQVVALGQGVFVAVGADGRLLRSADQGRHWQRRETLARGRLQVDAGAAQVWLLGNGGLWRSTDGGENWHRVDAPAAGLNFLLRTRDSSLLGFGNGGAILRSTDDGATWTQPASGVGASLRQALQDPRSGELFVAGREGTVLRSQDDGQSWEALPTHTRAHLNRVWLAADGKALVATGERIVRIERR